MLLMTLKRSTRSLVPTCVLASLLLSIVGCADRNISRVSGEVAFDGRPVQAGVVVFEPTEGGAQARSLTIKDGKYEATTKIKLTPGKYVVRITAPDLSRSKPDAPVGPNDPAPRVFPLLPPAWNVQSQLNVELKPGDNTVHFRGTRTELPQVEVGEAK